MSKRLIVIFGFVVVLFAYAPAYLAYSDKPIKSDAIVLFVGPEHEARLKEAQNEELVAGDGTLRISPIHPHFEQ